MLQPMYIIKSTQLSVGRTFPSKSRMAWRAVGWYKPMRALNNECHVNIVNISPPLIDFAESLTGYGSWITCVCYTIEAHVPTPEWMKSWLITRDVRS